MMPGSLQLVDHKRDRVVWFGNRISDDCPEKPLYPVEGLYVESRAPFGSALDVIRRSFERSFRSFRTLSKLLSFQPLYYLSAEKPDHEEILLDPQGQFLQRWNKIFLVSCVLALAWDSMFFYIPVIDGKKKCLKLDEKLGNIVCVIRTLLDLFYLLHIVLQFRTGFICPISRVLGRGELVKDQVAIAKRYISSFFFVDVLAVLPFSQLAVLIIIPRLERHLTLTAKDLLTIVVLTQCIPRALRIYPLYKEVTRTSGILTATALGGAIFNLIIFMIASHVFGAGWYLFSIGQQDRCWHKTCIGPAGCHNLSFSCAYEKRSHTFNGTYCNPVNPDQIPDSSGFNYGMFYNALNSKVVESDNIFEKLFYCFWWGLQSLSSLGQNLHTSTYIGENLFASFICVSGLVLFSSLIGNMQTYLQSTTVRIEEMRVRRQDAEQWMSHRMLPEDLRKRIRRYEQYKWQETRGVDEENVIHNLPKDLRRDIKRHLCLALLMRVPMFEKMDEQLLDAMCDRLKPVLYTENSNIVREGDPVNEMLFIMRGRLLTMTTNGGRTGFFNSVFLNAGDFCGEELLTWALDPHSSSNLPISTRTVQSKTEVEAFALMPDDLRFVASQFRRLHSKQLRHTFRFYSQQWRTWAACFIQAAWRRHCRGKLEKSLQEAEDLLKNAIAREGGSSPSFGAAIYASRFAANALRNLRRKTDQNVRMSQRVSPPSLQKPTEPDFTSEEG